MSQDSPRYRAWPFEQAVQIIAQRAPHGDRLPPDSSTRAWTQYAPLESLLYYIYQNPHRARRLYWDVVPRCVDDYLQALRRYPRVPEAERPEQDVWHVGDRGARVPAYAAQVDFTMVNNLIAALGTDSAELLVDYLERYDPQALECHEVTRSLVEKGLSYYRDFVLPGKTYRRPDEEQRRLLRRLRDLLAVADPTDEESLQALPFDLARENGLEPKELFRIFYEVVLGQERGPRFGSFVRLIGCDRALAMLDERLQ